MSCCTLRSIKNFHGRLAVHAFSLQRTVVPRQQGRYMQQQEWIFLFLRSCNRCRCHHHNGNQQRRIHLSSLGERFGFFFRQYSSSSSDNGNNFENELAMTNLYQEWTLEQDQTLWNAYQNERKSIIELALLMGRGLGGIKARLAKLKDVESSAYERLFVGGVRQQNKKETNNGKSNKDAEKTVSSAKKLVPVSQVLQRIQWDYNLDASQFTFLHYDRVENILVESSVNAVNENILGKVRKLVDALPEHRIMAVKYRERVIWDRQERLDLMFGNDDDDDGGGGGGGIEQVVATYDAWKQEHDAQQQILQQRRIQIGNHLRQALGVELYAELEELVENLQPPPTAFASSLSGAPALVSKLEVEEVVHDLLELFREARNNDNPTSTIKSLDTTFIVPTSDLMALDLLSQWVVLLPREQCSKHLQTSILQEISMLLEQPVGVAGGQITPLRPLLPKKNMNRPLPELDEADLDESFARGSGPGGQKVNKTSNKVLLIHKPTGLRVECHETRSLPDNRKIARKRLRQKLDEFLYGSQSKLQQKQQRASAKKAKTKARARAKYQKLKQLKQEQQQQQQQSLSPTDNGDGNLNW